MSSSAANRSGFSDLTSLNKQRTELVQKLAENLKSQETLDTQLKGIKDRFELAQSNLSSHTLLTKEITELASLVSQTDEDIKSIRAQLESRYAELEQLTSPTQTEMSDFSFTVRQLSNNILFDKLIAARVRLKVHRSDLETRTIQLNRLSFNITEAQTTMTHYQQTEQEIINHKELGELIKAQIKDLEKRMKDISLLEIAAIQQALAEIQEITPLNSQEDNTKEKPMEDLKNSHQPPVSTRIKRKLVIDLSSSPSPTSAPASPTPPSDVAMDLTEAAHNKTSSFSPAPKIANSTLSFVSNLSTKDKSPEKSKLSRLRNSGPLSIAKKTTRSSSTASLSSSSTELKLEELQTHASRVSKLAFSRALNFLIDKKFLQQVIAQLQKFYADQRNTSSSSSTSSTMSSIAQSFELFLTQFRKNQISKPITSLIELFDNHINDLIKLSPITYAPILCDLLKHLAKTTVFHTERVPASELKLGAIELQHLLSSHLSSSIPSFTRSNELAQKEAFETAAKNISRAVDTLNKDKEFLEQPFNREQKNFAYAINLMLESAAVFKCQGKKEEYRLALSTLEQQLGNLADKLVAYAEEETQSLDDEPVLRSKTLTPIKPNYTKAEHIKEIQDCYKLAAYFYEKSIMLGTLLERKVLPALYLKPLSALSKAQQVDDGQNISVSKAMETYVNHFNLNQICNDWENTDDKNKLKSFMGSYQTTLPTGKKSLPL